MQGVQHQHHDHAGEAAAALPWLCPSADALIRLTDEPLPLSDLSNDVGLVLLCLRYGRSTGTADGFSFAALRESVVAEAASKLLTSHTKYRLDSAHPIATNLRAFSAQLVTAARQLAEAEGSVSPDAAAAVALLAPLGWWAVATVRPDAAVACRGDSHSVRDSLTTQRRHWGLSHEEIARRLCARWRLPTWVTATITTLSLSVADAVRCGADPDLTHVLRSAIRQVEAQPGFAGWLLPTATECVAELPAIVSDSSVRDEDPRTIRLLPQLLRSAARTRRAGNDQRVRAAEQEVDQLRRVLADLTDRFEVAVRDSKLAGLAELAAGAGHEINNPLAVISGNAQRLRKGEADADRRKTLDAIIRQSARISDIVRELMLYARPAAPVRTSVNTAELVTLAVAEFQPQAAVKGIHLTATVENESATCLFDGAQVRKTLAALVQNALQATPSGGLIVVHQQIDADRTRIRVEDTGPGPTDAAVPHLFDPFFCGRTAGRGRGLGLATAWRLATLNGGELQYQRASDGPTRFELVFPTMDTTLPTLRKLA